MIKPLHLALSASLALSAAFLPGACWADKCAHNVLITKINVGRLGADSNSNIVLTLDDGRTFPFNHAYNANDAQGAVLYAQALAAYLSQIHVDLWDDYGTRCDDINEIELQPN